MARIRTIKPSFWTDEHLSELPIEAHLLAAALLNHADDEGYFNANPKLVKAACCPLREDSVSVHECLIRLEEVGYIRLGSGADGKSYGQIANFNEHQRINRPTESKIKELVDFTESSVRAQCALNDDSPPEGNGREGNKESMTTPNGVVADSKAVSMCPHQKIIDLYHQHLPMCPIVRDWTDTRRRMLQTRWKEKKERQSLDWWEAFFMYVAKSDFLTGKLPGRNGGKPFLVDLEWLIKPTNFVKVIEGRYENGGK